MASLDRLQAMHGADGLQVLAVSVDREGDQVRRFYQKSGIRNLKVYIDSERGTQSAFRARAIPTVVTPGATTFTRTSCSPPYSLARMRAAWSSAALGPA